MDVTGPDSLDELAGRVGAILGQPVGRRAGDEIPVGDNVFVEANDDPDASSHPYIVAVFTGTGRADTDSRLIFDRLSAETPWDLELLDEDFVPLAARLANAS